MSTLSRLPFLTEVGENISALVLHLQANEEFSHILAPATNFGKNFIPRVAVKLDVAPISDVTAITDADNFERPVYAGNFLADITSSDPVKVVCAPRCRVMHKRECLIVVPKDLLWDF